MPSWIKFCLWCISPIITASHPSNCSNSALSSNSKPTEVIAPLTVAWNNPIYFLSFPYILRDSSILGLFAFGLSIDKDERANPTFFKLVGGNKGGLTKNEKYPGGSNTDLAKGEPVIITDTIKSANITISGKLDIIKDGEIERTEDVSKTFRGDFGRSIGIV